MHRELKLAAVALRNILSMCLFSKENLLAVSEAHGLTVVDIDKAIIVNPSTSAHAKDVGVLTKVNQMSNEGG